MRGLDQDGREGNQLLNKQIEEYAVKRSLKKFIVSK